MSKWMTDSELVEVLGPEWVGLGENEEDSFILSAETAGDYKMFVECANDWLAKKGMMMRMVECRDASNEDELEWLVKFG